MSEFCIKCVAHEANIELLMKKHYEEVKMFQEKIAKLEDEVDRLSFDLAFFLSDVLNATMTGSFTYDTVLPILL